MVVKRGVDYYTKVHFDHWEIFPEDDFDCSHCPYLHTDRQGRLYCCLTKHNIYRPNGCIDNNCPADRLITKDGAEEIIDG